jgi:hypothetical protein
MRRLSLLAIALTYATLGTAPGALDARTSSQDELSVAVPAAVR